MLAEMGITWPLQLPRSNLSLPTGAWITVTTGPLTGAEDRLLASIERAVQVGLDVKTTRWVVEERELASLHLSATDHPECVFVLFGDEIAKMMLGTDVEDRTISTSRGKAVVTHSLSELIRDPLKKREVWEHLCTALDER